MQTKAKKQNTIQSLVCSAVCLALCLVLPFFTGQIPQIGSMLCPMHIPVLLAGFLCGPWWGMAVGLVTPALRFVLFGMPPLMPVGLAMTFELAAYGLVAGLLYGVLPKRMYGVYASLFGAMLVGRFVWGVACVFIFGALDTEFTWAVFMTGAFLNAIPGIVLHILVIPAIVFALKKTTLLRN